MREKYETLSLTVLRELAKARGLKGVSGLKKSDLIDRMVTEDEKLKEPGAPSESEMEDEGSKKKAEEPKRAGDEVQKSDKLEAEQTEPERPEPVNRTEKTEKTNKTARPRRQEENNKEDINPELDSGVTADGILEVMPDGYGFIRCENYLPGEHDVYVSPSQIRRFGLKTGDIVRGNTRIKTQGEKFSALLYITTINGYHPSVVVQRRNFEDMTPIFPNERLRLETNRTTTSMRIVDLVSPIGKGQRGMIVSPPKAGKTTLLKQIAQAVKVNNPEIHLIILLIDERPEEVTDIKEAIEGIT